ncbi:MAG: helix-turn-helix transcriptional regulator [Patescibacteria group bacterium]|nr:helix-turn-helix transcriptional regulator [Patescibacteria group bacterium]
MKNWKIFKKEILKDKEVAKEYQKLGPKYKLIIQVIDARQKKGLTQKELAKKIGTKQSAIARLESGNANPSLEFLMKLAKATETELIVQLK